MPSKDKELSIPLVFSPFYVKTQGMIKIGKMNTLKVLRKVDHGFYLQGDEEWEDILLPRRLAPDSLAINDDIEVFVHFDSNDMICATPQVPYAMVGDFAALEVSKVEEFGVFLDWGLDKELFVPFKEQLFKLEPGQVCAVYIYQDKSDRIAASTRLKKHIDTGKPNLRVGDEVNLLLYQRTDLGMKAIINNRYSGLLYNENIHSDLRPGQKTKGFVSKIREDYKIDLVLQPQGLRGRKDLADQILDKIKESGGTLNVSARTPADEISRMFGVSRKKFKVALGFLYKKRMIVIEDDQIKLP